MPSRWSVGGLMLLVLAIGLALGLLRSPLGPIVALAAGGVIGCGLAPWFACRGMRKLDRELAHARGDAPPSSPQARHRASLVAQSYVLIWAGWFLAGVAVAAIGLLLHHFLRQ
jgi:hypothetical protein